MFYMFVVLMTVTGALHAISLLLQRFNTEPTRPGAKRTCFDQPFLQAGLMMDGELCSMVMNLWTWRPEKAEAAKAVPSWRFLIPCCATVTSQARRRAVLALLVFFSIMIRQRRTKGQRQLPHAESACHLVGDWPDAGIVSKAKPWTLQTTVVGIFLGVGGFTAMLPVLVPFAVWSTACEALRHALGLDPYVTASEEGSDDQVTLVMPGTCTYVWWQSGMVQYLCEHFDTSEAKLAGVSSGAVCAAQIVAYEKAAAGGDRSLAGKRVRQRALHFFADVEENMSSITAWPLGFIGRFGEAVNPAILKLLPEDFDAKALGSRVHIGFRRLEGRWLPALLPDATPEFDSREDLLWAMRASAHVGIIVQPSPLLFHEKKQAWCCDGVNPFSFYCFFEYLVQLRRGIASRVAPASLMNGVDAIYALWNCGALRALLPQRGTKLWVTPTLGGKLDPRSSLRVSAWWTAEQWRLGYEHARELDSQGYWSALPRRAAH